jgi:hypothetical protein
MIRPEQIRLSASREGHPAVVSAVAYYGHDCSVTLTGMGLPGRFTALVPGHATPHLGEHVGLRVEGSVMVYGDQMVRARPVNA